jgi:hypothetical protein
MMDKKENRRKDRIEKIMDDVFEDVENEFITGIVPEENGQGEQEQPDTFTQEPETSTSQARGKRHAHIRKKRKKSMHSLLHSVKEDAVLSDSSSSSSETQGNQHQYDDVLSDASDSD